MSLASAQPCIDTFRQWGYDVQVGQTIGDQSSNYFSGSDDERLQDLQQMLDDDQVRAVFCARGGYGLSRIIDRVQFESFRKNPKWIIGFSDVTVLHTHVYVNFRVATLHAPMASAFPNGESANPYILSLKAALEGKKYRYQWPVNQFDRRGEAVGELTGGNLSLLAHLVGSRSDCKTRGRILLLEDVGEYLYNIDRMMHQLKRSRKLERLAGMIIGSFTENKDTTRPFGLSAYEIIYEAVRDYDFPLGFGFPSGHVRENYALKLGLGHKLRIGRNKASLEE
jgi:muramoyltetrapeptide carboxypeptidase